MRAFRVRDAGHVESHIGWKMMDGTAYVPVGGSNRSYVSVHPGLCLAGQREGTVTECGIELVSPRYVVLVPNKENDDRALVLVPSGAFDFRGVPVRSPSDSAWLFTLRPGESISAFPRVRSHADAATKKPLVLRFNGESVTFTGA